MFRQRIWKIATFQFDNYMELGRSEDGQSWVPKGGIETKFLNVLADKIGFSYEIVIPEDMEWGVKTEDGNWTGIFGMVWRNEVDMAMNSLDLTYDRFREANFSYPYLPDDVTFVTNKPDVIAKTFVFAWPFSLQVWLLIGFCIILYTILFSMNESVCKYGSRRRSQIGYLFFQFFGSIAGQAMRLSSTGRCGFAKIVLVPWLLFRLFLVLIYSCLILSWLMFVNHEAPVDTVDALIRALHQGNYAITTMKGSSYYSCMMAAKTGTLGELGLHLRKHEEFLLESSDDKRISEIFDNPETKIAFVYSRKIIKLNILKGPRGNRKLMLAKDSLLNQFAGAAVSRDFCCLAQVNDLIHRLGAAGLFRKWLEEELFYADSELRRPTANTTDDGDQSELEDHYEENSFRALNMQDLAGVFFILLAGYAIALLVFFSNYVIQRSKRSRRTKKKTIATPLVTALVLHRRK